MRLKKLLIGFLLIASPRAFAQSPNVQGVDLYGTSQVTIEQVRKRLGGEIDNLVKSYSGGDMEAFGKLQEQIIAGVQAMGKFAFVRPSVVQYYTEGKPIYVTIDVVDQKDAASRMDFIPAPAGEFADPDNLFAQWAEYEKAGFALMAKGELNYNSATDPCPALHCIFGFSHPALKKYEEVFRAGALKHRARLAEILRQDKNWAHRGYAAYLLAHTNDAREVVPLMLASIRDSSSFVRNNAMRVLILIAQRNKDVEIPLAPIIKAIDYPETTDRNKALYVMDGLADKPANKERLVREVGRKLVVLLRLSQPNNHDPAYSILKKISGKSFGERDYKSWEQWVEAAAK